MAPSGCGGSLWACVAVGVVGVVVGCGAPDSAGSTTSTTGGGAGGAPACGSRLFGRPNEKTGLDASACGPACDGCGGAFEEAPWTPERIAALRTWTIIDPPALLDADPYASLAPVVPDGAVCGVLVLDEAARTYELADFASDAEAVAAGARVTHQGVCGLCSTLEDLAVYAEELDLTAPVRACGIESAGDLAANVACLEGLGFTPPCAQIWAYNTANTRALCLDDCLALIDAPYHEPDGSLNACLACDEAQSGPVFKAIAGRTRRNTGIASALCRPCDEVARIAHDYP
jgi:hypothetical protein